MTTIAASKRKKPGKWANIIEEVKKQLSILEGEGLIPMLRTMHYRLTSIPNLKYSNTMNEYKELSRQTARARELKILPPTCFEDRGRRIIENGYKRDGELRDPEYYVNNAISLLKTLDEDYLEYGALPRWYKQRNYVEVWLEKEAQVSTFEKALEGYSVVIVPNKGYSSFAYIYNNCQRLMYIQANEPLKKIYIRYFGDFDPSGDDMCRDIVKRIEDYTGWMEGLQFHFEKIAVKLQHVTQYDLPSKPDDAATMEKYNNDPRKDKFEAKYEGTYAVELDALGVYAPDQYLEMIRDSVTFDDVGGRLFDEAIHKAEQDKRSTSEFKKSIRQRVYDSTKEFLDGYEVDDA